MKYVSTRNGSIRYDFQTILFDGFSSDGGLHVPETLPQVPWRQWKGRSYQYVVGELLKLFVDDPELPVEELVKRAYGETNFDHPSIAPLKKLGHTNTYVLELFHGPTWSFKDYAITLIGELLDFYLKKSDKRLCLLVATSGDTGSAAIESVKEKSNIDIVVLFPRNNISKIQELQMITVNAENVHPIQVDANSDEFDTIIREVTTDKDFVKKHSLGTINSINWARICIQMAHWFYAYLEISTDFDESIIFTVPVGTCGNLTAGFYAQKMGLPIEILACTNKNDVFHKFLQSGCLRSGVAEKSLAVSMDIQVCVCTFTIDSFVKVPYNVERMLSLLDEDDTFTKRTMEEYYATNSCQTSNKTKESLQQYVKSCVVSDEEILSTIEMAVEKFAYECCPHTATAIYGATTINDSDKRSKVCISTAAPWKFPDIFKSIGLNPPKNDRLKILLDKPLQQFYQWQKSDDVVQLLRDEIIRITLSYNS